MNAPVKLPENHEFVLNVIQRQGTGKHLDTSKILDLARRERPKFSNATLYRALRRLTDEGLVAELALPGAPAVSYEIAEDEHAHFQCSRCGKIADVPFVLRAETVRKLADDQAVTIDNVAISFTGRCAACTTLS